MLRTLSLSIFNSLILLLREFGSLFKVFVITLKSTGLFIFEIFDIKVFPAASKVKSDLFAALVMVVYTDSYCLSFTPGLTLILPISFIAAFKLPPW